MKRYYSNDEPLTVLPELDQPLLHPIWRQRLRSCGSQNRGNERQGEARKHC